MAIMIFGNFGGAAGFSRWVFWWRQLEFSSLTTNLSKLNSDKYEATVEADLKILKLLARSVLGHSSPSNVKGKFYLDRANVRVSAESELRVKDPDYTEIIGELQMLTKFDQWMDLVIAHTNPVGPLSCF